MVPINPDNSSEPHRKERRRHPRKTIAVDVEIQLEGIAAPIRTKVADLTLGGCYLEMMFTLDMGTELKITLWINDVKVSTGGRVVTRFRNLGNGIEFTEMSLEDRSRLEQFLATAQDAQSPR
jgi:hypothetical protein